MLYCPVRRPSSFGVACAAGMRGGSAWNVPRSGVMLLCRPLGRTVEGVAAPGAFLDAPLPPAAF
jgi:hypothetical protein